MNQYDDCKIKYDQEINRAEKARQDGNEGMARVCARRAAGIVVGEYLLPTSFWITTQGLFFPVSEPLIGSKSTWTMSPLFNSISIKYSPHPNT